MYIGSIPVRASKKTLPEFIGSLGELRLSDDGLSECGLQRMILAYRYRLLPSRRQHRALEWILECQRQLYNAALEERIGAYRHGITRSYFDQSRALTEWRQTDPDARAVPVTVQRATLKRLDLAYKAFFRRIASGEAPGFPRFRGKGWFDSFGTRDFCGITLRNGRLRFGGIPGGLRIHFHRPLPAGSLRNCMFRREGRAWFISIAVHVNETALRPVRKVVGIDLGLSTFAALSDGGSIPTLRAARRAEKALRIAQRSLARKKPRSRGRDEARSELQRCFARVRRQRDAHLHQASASLTRRYEVIAIESLEIRGLCRSGLAKSIRDAAWGKFVAMLRYKAERAGARIIEVDPRNTSQDCSVCGSRVPKARDERRHDCPTCGLSIDRDVNAARNILLRAGAGPGHA